MSNNKFWRWILYYILVFMTSAIVFCGAWYIIASVIAKDFEDDVRPVGLAIVGGSCIYSIIITGVTTIIVFYGYHRLLGLNAIAKK